MKKLIVLLALMVSSIHASADLIASSGGYEIYREGAGWRMVKPAALTVEKPEIVMVRITSHHYPTEIVVRLPNGQELNIVKSASRGYPRVSEVRLKAGAKDASLQLIFRNKSAMTYKLSDSGLEIRREMISRDSVLSDLRSRIELPTFDDENLKQMGLVADIAEKRSCDDASMGVRDRVTYSIRVSGVQIP